MKHNALGGLVIFLIVVTCLIMIDDISQTEQPTPTYETAEVNKISVDSDLAIIESVE